jgi:hypothetical protein
MSFHSSPRPAGTIALTAFFLFASGSACDPARNTGPAASIRAAVQPPAGPETRVAAARLFTSRYAGSRLAGWNVHAEAAGPECSVLLIGMSVIMEDSMIEAMHYGTGAYDAVDGGVQRFYREHTFRGVAYKDGSGRIWTYGVVSQHEAATLTPCS